MTDDSTIQIKITFNDADLNSEDLEKEALWLMQELKERDEVETVNRVLDPAPPDGNKALGGFLVGMLSAEVNVENGKKLLGFLGDRLGNKPIEMEVEGNGRKLKVKASSREELQAAIEAAQSFISS